MDIQLRPVQHQDVPVLADLLGQLGYPTTETAARERLDLWLDDPASWLIGADDDGELVGVAALHVMPLLQLTGKAGRLVALVVDERYRSRGVGQSLVAAAEDQARAAGCAKMEVTSRRHRTRTHEFYKLLGYEDICSSSARFVKLFPTD
ncbi:GNAT family N-acetyltransferase [Actinoplanes sp. ATCC 53533]|uniref:GNAT family N-acetyltransferase n=1 Tax=Actinoplanes sp. ATCC 53533 TaxID=1288362 RepID=UPI000F79E8D4|nr:GNAT family N-acetyltransferase [Actinoplanes sp. ATCC 53533]RSM71818.1 GNAT family N-acetyltransferase [Actinoplanes sp. ATCC 53533]